MREGSLFLVKKNQDLSLPKNGGKKEIEKFEPDVPENVRAEMMKEMQDSWNRARE